ncbi:MAG: lysophospholipid acyltransferase family protein [Lachnospiraceae bacterium]
MIRFIILATTVITFLIVSIPILVAEWIIGKFNMELKDRSSLAIVLFMFRLCLWITGVRVTVLGEENVPKDKAVLYVGNHRSYFDILLTYVRVPRPTGYIAKVEMLRYPSLCQWMKNLHCQFLDRHDLKAGLKTILSSIETVKSGISICVFPEGTRNHVNDTFLPFHAGSFKIAEKSGCPIIPIAINNAADIFEDHFPKIRKTHVVLEYGAPISMSEMNKDEKKEIDTLVLDTIKSMYFKNKELV